MSIRTTAIGGVYGLTIVVIVVLASYFGTACLAITFLSMLWLVGLGDAIPSESLWTAQQALAGVLMCSAGVWCGWRIFGPRR